ncbi:hypothetical protein [uncultured Herbaspirillum sp.]|uniref:hypothetical protein n=1 Tax=uncultured Herbaspirillum sp. TaxID=160236 RepID=UPI0025897D7A|nr:hypothetical protein [uncultured Herbaspirillum sp.]
MSEEYAYKDGADRWVPGYSTRQDAIKAGLADGRTQITTAKLEMECPSYFARFEAKTILSRMIFGLQNGEKIGKLVGSEAAVEFLKRIEKAEIEFPAPSSREYELQIDLMNRLQNSVASWVSDNKLDFERPKCIVYMSEELHVAGPDLNIQLL